MERALRSVASMKKNTPAKKLALAVKTIAVVTQDTLRTVAGASGLAQCVPTTQAENL